MEQMKTFESQVGEHARETARVREAWEKILIERADLLDDQCGKLTENSGGAIRARVQRFADTSLIVESLRKALSGSRVQGNKIDDLGTFIKAAKDPSVE